MRRKDREMGIDFALKVIDESDYGVMGLRKAAPYTMPLSIVRDGENLYFHSAVQGRKTEMIEDGDEVSISFVSRVNVPSLLSRDEIIEKIQQKKFAEIGSKVFTTEFESAHVIGHISKVEDKEEIIKALKLIVNKYTPELEDLADEFIVNSLERTSVYKITIEGLSGKRKKFDVNGEEMKFGRIE